ncbi:MAG: histidine kinase [Bacteroidia bacterium]|jgi:sensor histidine kinase YesM|nr:histidine kinase [Bacteroidia bacterium]
MELPGIRINRRQLYWTFQLGGWTVYAVLNAVYLVLAERFSAAIAVELVLLWLMGISLTQSLRTVIIRRNWLRLPLPKVIPRMLGMILLMAVPMQMLHILFRVLLVGNSGVEENTTGLLLGVFNFAFFFLLWSLIYFTVHYLEQARQTEIRNLRWEAAMRETELNRLKAQLNPHFMFNALNSIRALVDEDPQRARDAVTQLSGLLRTTLQMGKQKVIPFEQEAEAIRNYLALETARFEERLQFKIDIAPGSENIFVPPMMVQTLVENGIKHGIARLPKGGIITLEARPDENGLHIKITNSGLWQPNASPESGFGLRNTEERLQLLYHGRASFQIGSGPGQTVITSLYLPKQLST